MVSFRIQNCPFDSHNRSLAAAASSKLGSMRESLCLFGDSVFVLKCFWSLLLLVSEYCSPVWMFTRTSHLRLLDRVASRAERLSDGLVVCEF